MKIRIKGNSIRYRLSKTDVATLTTNGRLCEQTDFGNRQLTYALEASTGTALEARFDGDTITLQMPQAWLAGWEVSNQVGFSSTQLLSNGNSLQLLLEKDFKCLDATTEDQSDNYENPQTAHTVCP